MSPHVGNGAANGSAEERVAAAPAPKKKGGILEVLRAIAGLGETLAAMSRRLDVIERKLDRIALSAGVTDPTDSRP